MARQLIVVDVETTGLHDKAAILEVGAINLDTGESMRFVPFVDCKQLGDAQPEAMEINRYYERGLWREQIDVRETARAYRELQEWLRGNTFAGSNPTFDSELIARQVTDWGAIFTSYVGKVWHHRLADLAAYAAGKLDVDPTELQGLDGVAERLGVPSVDRHTALADAYATAICFDTLRNTKAAAL
ncbi:DNA polymerase exonuclease subunit [Mycobacterium phage MacnCheese]|uniref:DnaQ-like DNA polymerase III subunit n=1 Tax=Mycobacterium phage MacnCheese TaxID=2927982 RepID=I6W7W9_9CAUD|nr:DNA polymerase exonuclease subunit [Mycobacterium phage MacnCheese]AFN37750.1 DnaQ-like DNA polymerase III subunit [Mycobacterium phage MacnCheese]